MVNVASQIPFNLHNRVLPEEPYANSRSASMDMYNSGYDDGMDLRRRGRRQSSQLDRFPPLTPLASRPTSIYDHPLYTRPSSPDSFRETYRREPVLNVKLVGYTPPSRGRSVHRSHGPASPTTPEQGNLPSGGSAASQSADSDGTILAHPVQSNQFRLQDPGLICTSWGD
ncbi:hypothetical protein AMATHDRAFT_49069 [Amanita thiersii Skay4041]|uniref:Uncharacterized protein n=1 Tax=Amanita thiersii Skay4041 TaxID=703135 RepID=A0A2A9NMM3_9AGAR|nr:hypothetical protein AMATHDRAFT_49069 [Amanita thiersii Skay4041]